VRYVVALLLVGCATTKSFRAPHWDDTERERAAIHCAVKGMFGDAIAAKVSSVTVLETDNPPFREYVYCETCPHPKIVLDAALPSAAATAWEHAVFAHIVPAAMGYGWNYGHRSDEGNAIESALRSRLSLCKKGIP
jgi:hypothetical protein